MSSTKKIVVFKIGDEDFAADIMQVERILGFAEPTKVPEAPAFIKGVIKYEDRILPIVDLKRRIGLSDTIIKDDPKIIVVKHNERKIGLIVDLVSEVIDIDGGSIEEAPEIVMGISNRYLAGMIKLESRIVIFIDTEKLLTKEEIQELSSL
jgi:purine-binding chemotaxis protein CheW